MEWTALDLCPTMAAAPQARASNACWLGLLAPIHLVPITPHCLPDTSTFGIHCHLPGPWVLNVYNSPSSISPTYFIEMILSWVSLHPRGRECVLFTLGLMSPEGWGRVL